VKDKATGGKGARTQERAPRRTAETPTGYNLGKRQVR